MKKKVVPFLKSTKTHSPEETNIVDYGTFGDLDYEIHYNDGNPVIHIKQIKQAQKAGQIPLCFKKDVNLFDTEVDTKKIESLSVGDIFLVKGSGDNDDLVFKNTSGNITLSLKHKEHPVIDKIKKILSKKIKT